MTILVISLLAALLGVGCVTGSEAPVATHTPDEKIRLAKLALDRFRDANPEIDIYEDVGIGQSVHVEGQTIDIGLGYVGATVSFDGRVVDDDDIDVLIDLNKSAREIQRFVVTIDTDDDGSRDLALVDDDLDGEIDRENSFQQSVLQILNPSRIDDYALNHVDPEVTAVAPRTYDAKIDAATTALTLIDSGAYSEYDETTFILRVYGRRVRIGIGEAGAQITFSFDGMLRELEDIDILVTRDVAKSKITGYHFLADTDKDGLIDAWLVDDDLDGIIDYQEPVE